MNPTAEQVKAARKRYRLTQAEAAALAGLGSRARWAEYEAGTRRMPQFRLDYFKLKAKGGK